MEKTILPVLITIFGMVSVCAGKVSTRVCWADGNTPLEPFEVNSVEPNILEYRDIMVGTKLTIIVSSDVNEPWLGDILDGGRLAIYEEYWDYGVLSGRDYSDDTNDYKGSRFPAAGSQARVWDWDESGVKGFMMYTDSFGVEAGDWFIIDYNATSVGICEVAFYDHSIVWNEPNLYLMFTHVPTRDFNKDTIVNFADLAVLASYWEEEDCGDVNGCEGTDLNIDGTVDNNDLMLFTDYWLDRTE